MYSADITITQKGYFFGSRAPLNSENANNREFPKKIFKNQIVMMVFLLGNSGWA